MATRVVNGNTNTENGWVLVDQGSCVWVQVRGTKVSLQIREGQPAAIMGAFAADFHAYVEPLRDPDSACYTESNSVLGTPGRNNGSNHMSATAMDLNWNSHPFRILNAGFSPAQIATIRELLAFYEDMIWWGNDWNSPKDAMHFQMGYDTFGSENVARVQDFINRKIRTDGYSTFRRGATAPVPAGRDAEIFARASGLTISRAAELLPTLSSGLWAADCTNPNRIAMFIAQCGHESAGFARTEEYASGDAYDTRTDLGNTAAVDGDGRLYKGRSWIQITGKSNYRQFSAWAHGKGLVPTATYFVDHPVELQDMRWSGVGAAWYWTVARGDRINKAADARDLVTVTQLINGGQTGIDDRRRRYNLALPLGNDLLELLSDDGAPPTSDPWEELMATKVKSLSIYANPGEEAIEASTMIAALDAHGPHEPYVENLARQGDLDSIRRIARTAAGQGAYTHAAAISQATRVLNEIYATNPAFIVAAKQ